MSKNLVVIFGSGASFDSGYQVHIGGNKIDPPTDNDFFQRIVDNLLKEEYYALWKFKQLYFPNNHSQRMEDVWTAVDLNHKHIRLGTYNWVKETDEYLMGEYSRFGNRYPQMDISYHPFPGGRFNTSPSYSIYKFLGDCQRDFRRLIYNVYSSYLIPNSMDNFKLLHSQLLEKPDRCKLLAYISFNYDCYLEQALTPNFKYINMNDNPQDIALLLQGKIPIIKLHGSLSWEEKANPHLITFQSPPYDKSRQVEPAYNSDGNWSQAAIIPPTIFKQEINDDARTNDFLTQAILQQWKAAIRILEDADKIIIIGYSYPPTDYHSRRIFHISRMRRIMEHKPPFQILHCGGGEDKINAILEIFGSDSVIQIKNKFSELCDSEELDNFLNL